MAVMLRTLHIPSRIVTGFRGGEFNDLTGQYVVRASDAHSWVEAYFPGSGWVSFDPTPAGSLPARTGWSRMQLYLDAAASFWREWIINYDASHQRALGKDATTNSRHFLDEARRWIERSIALLRSARRAHAPLHQFSCAMAGRDCGALAALLIALLNLGRMIGGCARGHCGRIRSVPRANPPRFGMTGWWTAWHGGDGASCRRKRRWISWPPFRKRCYRRR
jgi:hypothetical protein